MTDSALGESTVTSPILSHLANNMCGDSSQVLSPDHDGGNIKYTLANAIFFFNMTKIKKIERLC